VATYYDIFGQKVQYLSSDPANLTEGQVWYNSTSGTAKVRGVTTSNTWASAGTHPAVTGPNGYLSYSAGFGTQTAGVSAGGYYVTTAGVYNYDGSTWTASGSLPSANNQLQGNGTQTAGFVFGGNVGTFNLNYDGSTWTTVGTMFSPSQATQGWFSAGTQTAVIASRAELAPTNETYIWDGATWTSSPGVLNTGRNTSGGSRCGSGTSSSAIFASGNIPNPVGSTLSAASEEWDGTCFTSGNPVNTACRGHMVTGTSITDSLKSQGNLNGGSFTNSTELYDGTSWATTSTAPYARTYSSGFGGAGLGLNFGGDTEGIPPTTVNTTIEWTGTFESTKTITTT